MKQNHPSETDLALLAGGDCSWLRRFLLRRHVSRCGDCGDTLASFGELRTVIRESGVGEAVDGLDWNHLAGEMRANIRLGLAAGECVSESPVAAPRWSWRPQLAVGLACAVLVTGAGVFLHGLLPRDAAPAGAAAEVLESTGAGVEVRTNSGSSMTLLNPGDVPADQTITSQGALRASYVDAGTVTVTSVNYVE